MKIFIGCDGNATDAESLSVLEYTIRKYASEPVDITLMRLSRNPSDFYYSDGVHGWNTERWPTPFSAFRWTVAASCEFEGRAIYMDSDILVRADLAELWNQDMGGKAVLGREGGRLCVSLWDCAAAKAHVWPIQQMRVNPHAHRIMSGVFRDPNILGTFDGEWNVLDGIGFPDIRDPTIKACHYTSIDSQLHLKHALPRLKAAGASHWFDGVMRPHPRQDLQALFDELLAEALEAGYPPERYIPAELFGDYRKASLQNYRGRA